MSGDDSGESPAVEGPQADQPSVPPPPTVKHGRRGGVAFNVSGPARNVQGARHTKDAYEHEIKLREIDREEARQRDEHELKQARQVAEIEENHRENDSRRWFRIVYFVMPVVGVLALIALETLLHLNADLPADKLGTVDGVIRLAIGWFIGMVSAGAIKAGESKSAPSGD